jgi:hypothetical protein
MEKSKQQKREDLPEDFFVTISRKNGNISKTLKHLQELNILPNPESFDNSNNVILAGIEIAKRCREILEQMDQFNTTEKSEFPDIAVQVQGAIFNLLERTLDTQQDESELRTYKLSPANELVVSN